MLRCASSWPPLLQKKPLIDFVHACQSPRISFYRSNSQSTLSSVVRFLSPIPFRCISRSIFLAVSAFVLASISSTSSLQYRRYALIRPSSFPPFFPTFPSAIFNFLSPRLRQCTLVFRSYYFNLFSTRFSTPTHPPLLVSSLIVANRHRSLRRGDRAWGGGT